MLWPVMIIKEKAIKSHKNLQRVLRYIFGKETMELTHRQFIRGDRAFQKQLEQVSCNTEAYSIVMDKRLRNLQEQFMANDKGRLHRRQGETKYYHCILSFHREDRLEEQALMKVARKYTQERFPKSLVIATAHTDKDHLHLHLVGSNVTYGLGTTCRLTKLEFQKMKQRMEHWQNRELGLSHSKVDHGKKKPSRYARMPSIKSISKDNEVRNNS